MVNRTVAGAGSDNAVMVIQQCLAVPVDYTQYVVPYLDSTRLLHYLIHVPQGLMYCLLSQKPHPKSLDKDCYFPDGFCRQKLLKNVADGCLKDNTLQDKMLQQDYQCHWEQLQWDMGLMFQGMQPLDGQDLRHLEHLFGLLHANGLMASLNMTLDTLFRCFYNDVMSVRPQLMADHPPQDNAELVRWHYYLLEWINIKSAGWPNRGLYTTLVAGCRQATATAAGASADEAIVLDQQCFALPVDYAQYVVPYLDLTHLLHYLTCVPRGLMYCLLSQKPHPKSMDPDCYFSDGFCRQKLLKKVADGCFKVNSIKNKIKQPNYQDQWKQLQRDMGLMFQGMQPLDGQDL